ncbi:hypothetical protein [Streptomyces violascens]|uniref:hypothetical protein n=1 Tax=Streptomyces violascens TaxID=67381 RepID=UPI0036B86D49
MDLYVEIQLSQTRSPACGSAVSRWFRSSMSGFLGGLTDAGIPLAATLVRREDDPSEIFDDGEIATGFVQALEVCPFWAQVDAYSGDIQLGRVRSSWSSIGSDYSTLSVGMQCGEDALADRAYCSWIVDCLVDAIGDTDAAFGRIEYKQFSDRSNLDIGLRRRPREFLCKAGDILRGYAWVTVCPREVISMLGGIASISSSGAFFRVIPLPSGGAVLQASESLSGYTDDVMERVFLALAPALPSGMPKSDPAFPSVRFFPGDALSGL